MKNITRISLFLVFSLLSTFVFADSQKVLITEFMAINSNNITDEDGEHSDWIELYNNTDATVDLTGWFLTDDANNLKKWQFPAVSLNKGAYLVVFASGKDRALTTGNLHTNFKLSGSGEFLAVCEPDSTISCSYTPTFPAQRQDVSYGLYQGQYVYFTTATPGTDNVAGSLPFAPVFSNTRGFYTSSFNLSISIPDGNGKIYYTTNGTRPTATTGTLYTAPITISTTTPVSAVTINSSGVSSEIITNTYLFPADIINQSATPAGYPTDWKPVANTTSVKSDYEMDPDICKSATYKDRIIPALKSIPTMCIVTNIDYLFSNVNNSTTGGIYIYTGKGSLAGGGTGLDWVRPTSIEYFDPNSNSTFQANCQLKLHGGNSRDPGNCPKHGFEFVFKSAYGPSKLNFDLFEEKKSTKEFNSFILRGGYNYTWVKNSAAQQVPAQYIQDPWAKNTQLDMGHLSGHERFAHLYINGLYWGMYNLAEDYSDDFAESYLGGTKTDFDVIKEQQYGTSTSPTAGDYTAWASFLTQVQTTNISTNTNYQKIQGKNDDGSVNSSYPKLLDAGNYIDYMLINYYLGNQDWDKNNWCAIRNRITNDQGFKFFCWDAETTMTAIGTNLVSASSTANNPTKFITYLIKNSDFKVKLADKIQESMINTGGFLTPAVNIIRYNKLADEIDQAIIGESARWGDWYNNTGPYTRDTYWITRKNDLLNNYFPFRTDTVIKQLRNAGYFPTIDAPVFTNYGGIINSPINLGMTAKSGTIYYTIDGSDPRTSVTGVIGTTASAYTKALSVGSSITVRARAKTSTEWSAITEATFEYDGGNGVGTLLAEQLACSNFPNPFATSTKISMNIPSTGDLQIDVINLDGKFVANVFKGKAPSGQNEFEWNASSVPNGIYVCRITYAGQNTYLKLVKK